jgi:hypothetical protein
MSHLPRCGLQGTPAGHDSLHALSREVFAAHSLTLGSNISSCANLAPAHTGTIWVWKNLMALAPYNAHHNHNLRIEHLYKRGIRCFIMTIRPPHARLSTAFKQTFGRVVSVPPNVRAMKDYGATTPHEFVEAFRLAATSGGNTSADVLSRYNRGRTHTAKVKVRDAFATGEQHSWVDISKDPALPQSEVNGFHTLLPQVRYAEGIAQYPDARLHLLCTDDLLHDWSTLLLTGPPTVRVASFLRHNHAYGIEEWSEKPTSQWVAADVEHPGVTGERYFKLSSNHTKHASSRGKASAKFQLSDNDADYVNHCLFPEDMWLVQRVCGGRPPPPPPLR